MMEPHENESPQTVDSSTSLDAKQASAGARAIFILSLMVLSLLSAFVVSRQDSRLPEGTAQDSESSSEDFLKFFESDSGKDGIAIVNVSGAIQTESAGSPWQEQQGADAIVRHLQQLSKNKRVKAVVVRLNTPGGTVGASQEIYQELMRLKQKGVKVVASMADICASGGVYIAAAADRVIANPGTLTGSIGVIFNLANVEQLMEKLGVKALNIKSGKFKDIGSMAREMTEEERQLLQTLVDTTYEQFVKAVAEGRKLEMDKVRAMADGSIFTGMQATELGLVDRTGTLQDAIEEAQKLADLAEPHIIRSGSKPWEQLNLIFGSIFRPFTNTAQKLLPQFASESPLLYLWTGGIRL